MSVRGTRAPRCLLSSEIQKPSEAPRASAASTGATRETARPKIAAAEKIVTSHRTIRMGLGPDASNASSGHSLGGLIVFRSRVAGPNVVSIHESRGRGGRHRRAAHWAMLSGLAVTHKKPTSKNRSHTREERKTRTAYAIKQKIAHVGLSAPHDGAQLKNADIAALSSTHERRQGLRFGPRFKSLRRRHQNRLMENSSSTASFQKESGLMSIQWMRVSATSISSSRRPRTWASTR